MSHDSSGVRPLYGQFLTPSRATAWAAAAENRDQLKQRVDKAEDDAKQAMQDARQQAEQTADRAQSKWAQMSTSSVLSFCRPFRPAPRASPSYESIESAHSRPSLP